MSNKGIACTRLLVTILVTVVTSFRILAQDSTKRLTLRASLDAAMSGNRSIQLAKLDETIASAGFKETDAIYLPRISLSYSAFSTNNPLNAFGFTLQQKSINQQDFDPALLNHPSAIADFAAKIEIEQPLINTDLYFKRKAAASQIEVFRYKSLRTQEYLVLAVQNAYLHQQLAYDAFRVFEEGLRLSDSVARFALDHFNAGLIQKSDLLAAQLEVSTMQSSLARARSEIRTSSDELSLLMGLPDGVIYIVDSTRESLAPGIDSGIRIPASRTDYLAMQKGIEAASLLIKAKENTSLPRLNAFGNYQLNDSRMLGFGAGGYFAGIQLSWDIFNGNSTKHGISTQKLEREKLRETLIQQQEQGQRELNKAFHTWADAHLEIKRQELAVSQAAEALNILQNRYRQGLVTTTDLLQAAAVVTRQKYALAEAVFTSNTTNALIEFLTSTNSTQIK